MIAFLQGMVTNVLASVVLAILIGVSVTFLAQRNRAGATFAGIGRTIVALVSAPVAYVQRVLESYATSGTGDERQFDDHQLLLKRVLNLAQLTVLLVALWQLSTRLVSGWAAMVPSDEAVMAYRAAVEVTETVPDSLARYRQELATLEAAWRGDSLGLIRLAAANDEARVAIAKATRDSIASAIASRPPAVRADLEPLLTALGHGANDPPDESAIRRFRAGQSALKDGLVNNSVGMSQVGYSPSDTSLLAAYLAARRSELDALAKLAAARGPDRRTVAQPTVGPTRDRVWTDSSQLATVREMLPALTDAADWKQQRFALAAVNGFIFAIASVWVLGLGVELAALGVDVASNVRRLRQQLDPNRGSLGSLPPIRSTTPTSSYKP